MDFNVKRLVAESRGGQREWVASWMPSGLALDVIAYNAADRKYYARSTSRRERWLPIDNICKTSKWPRPSETTFYFNPSVYADSPIEPGLFVIPQSWPEGREYFADATFVTDDAF